MVDESERQAIIDNEHLRLLVPCYWVIGGVSALFSLYGLFYVAMGLLFESVPPQGGSVYPPDAPPVFFGWVMIAFGLAFFLGGVTLATLQVLTGNWIRKRRRRAAVLVIAGITCMFVPFGTMIGVFTFVTLLRPSVVRLFLAERQPPHSETTADPTPSMVT